MVHFQTPHSWPHGLVKAASFCQTVDRFSLQCLSAADLTDRIFQSTAYFPLSEAVFNNMARFIVYFLTPEQNSGPVLSRNVCTEKFAGFVPSSLKPENFSSNGAPFITERDLTSILQRAQDDRDFQNVTGVSRFIFFTKLKTIATFTFHVLAILLFAPSRSP